MLEQLKAEVLAANLALPAHGLVTFTWGNVSAVDETRKLMVIKPSGVEYDVMTADDMVVVILPAATWLKAVKNPPQTRQPIWRCTAATLRSVGSSILTHATRRSGRRRVWISRHGAPRMPIISMVLFRVPG